MSINQIIMEFVLRWNFWKIAHSTFLPK